MDSAQLHARARRRGVNPFVYWMARAVLQPFFTAHFRLSRLGRANIPVSGSVIFAANHRSFLDPFVIGLLVRRPIYYMAHRGGRAPGLGGLTGVGSDA
jgi:glycerol-3-phosphate dehydrogenase (NAD(P)+)